MHTLGGYSAHADQKSLFDFIGRVKAKPRRMRLTHGGDEAKQALAQLLRQKNPGVELVVP